MSISPFEDDRDYAGQPAPSVWTFEDQRLAHLRGWSIMNLPETGPTIVRSHIVDVFDTDEEAAAHVEAHREESPLCFKAASYVETAGAEWRQENERIAA